MSNTPYPHCVQHHRPHYVQQPCPHCVNTPCPHCSALCVLQGMTLFMGLFYQCNDDSVYGKLDCLGIFENEEGIQTPRCCHCPCPPLCPPSVSSLTRCALYSIGSMFDCLKALLVITHLLFGAPLLSVILSAHLLLLGHRLLFHR